MLQIAMLIYPDMFDLDLIGPMTFFRRFGDADAFLVWKDRTPIVSDLGLSYAAHHGFESCPKDLDVLFVPGGLKGAVPVMRDRMTLDFLADRGARARYVTSVCTGSLLLGAAGLLQGYKAACHWMSRELLLLFGAEPAAGRVVVDRNRITGGGVTAGLDFGLTLAAALRGEDHAKMLQLNIEYDPQPPFDAGSPERAPVEMVKHLRELRASELAEARMAAEAAVRSPPAFSRP